jgi:hypothetical protein
MRNGYGDVRRRVVFVAVAAIIFLSFVQNGSFAQSATITVFADEIGSSCTIVDDSERLFDLHVIAKVVGWTLYGLRFRLADSPGFTADYVSETIYAEAFSGDLPSGLFAGYSCVNGLLHVATVTYLGHGTSQPCSYLEILPYPQSETGSAEIMDCYFDVYPAASEGPLLVNATPGQCEPWCTIAARETTWGAVKSLYR